MAKTFGEVIEQFRAEVEEGKHGRFSRSTFEDMATALLNDAEYTTMSYKMTKGEDGVDKPVAKDFKPGDGVRRFVFNTLVDFGVDRQEAEAVLKGGYEFKRLQGIHEFVSELLYNYAKTRSFNFISKEDFRGSLSIDQVEESTRTYTISPKFLEGDSDVPMESKIHYAPHETLRVKASPPEWVKTRL